MSTSTVTSAYLARKLGLRSFYGPPAPVARNASPSGAAHVATSYVKGVPSGGYFVATVQG